MLIVHWFQRNATGPTHANRPVGSTRRGVRAMAATGAACALTFLSGLGWAVEPTPAEGDAEFVELLDTSGYLVPDAVVAEDAAVTAAVAATTAAGRTPGSFAVTSSGAATYRIPIWTPPGVGSVGLDLVLVYNSRGGNGLIGQGWSLSGLSTIARCNRTVVQDGTAAGVTNTLADRYCLDGQQLKLVGGTYGTPGSVYATEIESYSRIVASGSKGNGPASFVVTSKNGLVYEYGTTADSQAFAGTSGSIRAWALSRVRDRAATTNGNSISITYFNEARNGAYTNGTFRVASIAYPTTAAGQGPFYRVSFDYSARPASDAVAGYLAGSVVLERNQLDSITIRNHASGATIKAYKLTYAQGTASGRLQLRSVQECSATDCLAPTTIAYQQGATGWNTAPIGTSFQSSNKASMRAVDLNGDGLSDLLYPVGTGGSVMSWRVAFGQPGGFGIPVDTGVTADAGVKLIPGRFLGNGRMQFMIPQGSSWTLLNYSGSGFQTVNTGLALGGEYLAADIDGDGLDDLISQAATSPVSLQARRNTTVPVAGSPLVAFAPVRETIWTAPGGARVGSDGYTNVADLNGDGRADLAVHTWAATKRGGSWLTPLLSNGFGAPFTVGAKRDFWQDGSLLVADWNADGCSDLLQISSVLVSNCAGDFTEVVTGATNVQLDAAGHSTVLPVDWDEDGRTDLLYVRAGSGLFGDTWYVVRSTGTGAAAPATTGVSAPTSTAWLALDIDGDGKPDLSLRDDKHNGNVLYHLHKTPGAPADLATSFSDGFGMVQSPRYVSISTGNYTKHADAAFPEVDFSGPLYVVGEFSASDGTGSTYQNRFWYYGARVHLQGRGFEGFYARRSYDTRSGTYTYDYLQRAFPFTGMHTRRSVWQSNLSSKVSEWSATLGQQSLGSPGREQRVFPHLATVSDSRYEVGGSLNGTPVTQVSESYIYGDGYGNRTQTKRTLTDKDPGSPFVNSSWQSTMTSSFANQTNSNCLGLPTSTVVTQSAPGQASRTRTTAYTVDTGTCRITKQVLEPASPSLKATTTLGFDACGNVISLQVVGSNPTGSAMPARTTSFGYGTRCQLPESITNPLGQKTGVSYQYDFGVPLSATDPNKLTTRWQYDDFGRRVLETRPDLTTTAWSFESCNTGPCWGATDLRFHVYQTSKGSAHEVYDQRELLYDGFDRLRSSGYMRVLGAWVTETYRYDSLGRPVARYQPTSGASNGYVAWTYDLLDRVIAQKLFQSNGTLDRSTTISHSGRRTLVTDALGRSRTRVTDVAGRLRRVMDPSPGGTTYYDYDSFGGLNRIQDPIGAVSSGAYNLRGFRTQWADADRGTWTFGGNSLNELVSWKDARGQAFGATYDVLGRPTSRAEPDGTSTWTWGTSAAAHNLGRLQSVKGYGYTESLGYDGVGRVATRTIATDQSYQYDYTYNSIGAPDTIAYPSSPVPAGQGGARLKLRYAYSYGAPTRITDVTQSPGKVLWTLNSANDYSSATSETLGTNLVAVTSAYKAWTNELTSRQSGTIPAANNRQRLTYQWDAVGNLTQRQDVNQSLVEKFSLDALNRVTSSTLNGASNLGVVYDASGNIRSRSDVGAYTYGNPAHPHAVTAAGSHGYTYDANGNQITRDGASQAWASFNLPVLLAQPVGGTSYQSQFSYGPTHQRWKQVASYSNGAETTLYVGGLLEKESTTSTGKTHWRHYVPTPTGTTIVVSRNSDASTSTHYQLTDHIGSGDAVLDASGNLVARESFAAFGARRGGNWSSGATPDWTGIAGTSRHGYTGHEHLDNLALIHMNGRVYDPMTGRFMSVDPVVGDLGDSQAVNPYSYVGNRPLTYIDPSGYDVVCGGVCMAVAVSVVKTAGNFIVGGGDRYVPPAAALPGQSAQTGTSMCGPGQSAPTCGGVVLSASASPGTSQVPSSSWAATGDSNGSTAEGYAGEPGSRAAAAGLILARDPNISTAVKLGAPIVLAVGTGGALLCAETTIFCPLLAIAVETHITAISELPIAGGGFIGKGVMGAAKSADTIAEGMRISTYRLTGRGETFVRYESSNAAFTRITPRGGVKRGTFAAPASDGVVPVADRIPVYNLPSPEIARPNAFTLTPPQGTTVVGPRPVQGGTGNEVIFPLGY
jgi:RHS repeat-associated protein